MQDVFALLAFGFFHPRKTNFSYRPGNTIIPPLIKRYPAAGHLCYCLGTFMLPGRSAILEKGAREKAFAGFKKSTCEFGKILLFIHSFFYGKSAWLYTKLLFEDGTEVFGIDKPGSFRNLRNRYALPQ